jgi:glycosyltransferase involved in cell wall biosynthesis
MSPPRISVLVRSIGRDTLAQALASIQAQGLPVRALVVLADDDRPDLDLPSSTGEVEVQWLRPPHRLRRSEAANLLLLHATTEFALFLDDDDWLLPGHLQRLLQALDEHPAAPAAHAGVVCRSSDRASPRELHVYDEPAPWGAMQLANRLPIHAVLFRTAAVAAEPPLRMDEALEQFEDWDFWLQLMARGGPFVYVAGVSAVYVVDADLGSGHADTSRPQRQRHLEAFGRRQLQRWQPADVAGLIELHGWLSGEAAQLRQQLAARNGELYRLREAHLQFVADHKQLRAAHERLHAELGIVAAERAQLADELAIASRYRQDLQRERDQQLQLRDQLLAEQETLRQSLAAYRQDLQRERDQQLQLRDQLLAEQETLRQSLAAYRHEAELLAALRLEHLRQIERLDGNVQALLDSTSWRVTRPLRLLGHAWAALRQGRLQTLARNGWLALRQECRRHGVLNVVRRAPHYARHAPRLARVLAARPPEPAAASPFAAPPRPASTARLRLHPELGPAPPDLDAKVSVVIPTLDAGTEFRPLLRKLLGQKGVREVEVVIVDSGSSDGTVAVARELGAVVVEIAPEEFSHSHARNLGARAASGDWLLFMVQDAYPIGDLWLHAMLAYLLEHAAAGVVAASCAEFSRSDSDLMYDCNIATHYRFLGCDQVDRIGRFSGADHMALRSQGQLSDVACMIGRPLFLSYGYRGDYAEDLGLGIRLIEDGHQVAMLASVKVVHSHNRPAYYYLKRSFVDVIFLVGMFDDFHSPPCESLRGLVDGALAVARALGRWLPQLQALPDGAPINDEVDRWLQTLAAPAPAADSAADAAIGDALFYRFLKDLRQQAAELPADGAGAAREAQQFVDAFTARARHLLQFSASVYGPADATLRNAMTDALRKTLASTLGAALAFCHLDRESPSLRGQPRQLIESLYTTLRQGV